MLRRLLALLTAMVLCFCAMIACADDDDDEEIDDDYWYTGDGIADFEVEEGTTDFRTIAGYDTEGELYVCGDYVYQLGDDGDSAFITTYSGTDTDVVVPATLDDHPVVAIGDFAFNYQSGIESVTLPEGVLSLGNMAFFQCDNLRTVTIQDGLLLIDQNCFGGCKMLSSINIPDTVERIGTFSFLACLSLTEISLGKGIKDIGSGAFQLCAQLARVTIPAGDGVTIQEDAFKDCSPDLVIVRE